MNIWINGIIREMTAEEIAAMQKSSMAEESTIEPLTDAKKLELMLAAIPEAPMPTVAKYVSSSNPFGTLCRR